MKKLLASTLVLGLFAFDNTLSFAAGDEENKQSGCFACLKKTKTVVNETIQIFQPLAEIGTKVTVDVLKIAGKENEAHLVEQWGSIASDGLTIFKDVTAEDSPGVRQVLTDALDTFLKVNGDPNTSTEQKIKSGTKFFKKLMKIRRDGGSTEAVLQFDKRLSTMKTLLVQHGIFTQQQVAMMQAGVTGAQAMLPVASSALNATGVQVPQLPSMQWPTTGAQGATVTTVPAGGQGGEA